MNNSVAISGTFNKSQGNFNKKFLKFLSSYLYEMY